MENRSQIIAPFGLSLFLVLIEIKGDEELRAEGK